MSRIRFYDLYVVAHLCEKEIKDYRNPFFSTEASDRNLTIIKLLAEVKTALEFRRPDKVATLTAEDSERAPLKT